MPYGAAMTWNLPSEDEEAWTAYLNLMPQRFRDYINADPEAGLRAYWQWKDMNSGVFGVSQNRRNIPWQRPPPPRLPARMTQQPVTAQDVAAMHARIAAMRHPSRAQRAAMRDPRPTSLPPIRHMPVPDWAGPYHPAGNAQSRNVQARNADILSDISNIFNRYGGAPRTGPPTLNAPTGYRVNPQVENPYGRYGQYGQGRWPYNMVTARRS